MTWTPQGNFLLNQAIADVSTTKKHDLGTLVPCKDPTYGAGEFIYLKGAASMAARDWVTYNAELGTATRLAANAIGPVGVAMGACTASYYGWFQISGYALGKCATQMASNTRVWISGTATVDDASVAGDGVRLAKSAALTVVDSGYTTFEIHRPFVDDRTSFS